MKKTLLFLILIWSNFLLGQGLILEEQQDTIYSQLPTIPIPKAGKKSTLDGINAWSLKAYCPKPKHQGQNGSCVGWSVGYAALTIQHALANNWKGQPYLITQNAFSPMFIYNQLKKGDCQSGIHIYHALNLLKEKGNILAKDFQGANNCNKLPSTKELATASAHKIAGFRTLFPLAAALQTKINQIKSSLLNNQPVIVGMKLPKNFEKIRRKSTYWRPKIRKKTTFFNHSMVVVGFDDSRGAFEVMNSWGEKWANKGFIWIRYRDFAKYCSQAFQLALPQKTAQEKQYTGRFSLRQFEALLANNKSIFSDKKVQLRDGIYTLRDKVQSTQTIFQLMAAQMTVNTYLYVLGIEPDGGIKTYWPNDQESAFIGDVAMEIFIPAPYEGLQFNKAGIERIILLYATKEIPDLAAYKTALGKVTENNIWKKLQSVFGETLVPKQYIQYHPKEMKFANNFPQGYILPIILEVVVTE